MIYIYPNNGPQACRENRRCFLDSSDNVPSLFFVFLRVFSRVTIKMQEDIASMGKLIGANV